MLLRAFPPLQDPREEDERQHTPHNRQPQRDLVTQGLREEADHLPRKGTKISDASAMAILRDEVTSPPVLGYDLPGERCPR